MSGEGRSSPAGSYTHCGVGIGGCLYFFELDDTFTNLSCLHLGEWMIFSAIDRLFTAERRDIFGKILNLVM